MSLRTEAREQIAQLLDLGWPEPEDVLDLPAVSKALAAVDAVDLVLAMTSSRVTEPDEYDRGYNVALQAVAYIIRSVVS